MTASPRLPPPRRLRLLFLLAALLAAGSAMALELRARDSVTGAPVEASVSLVPVRGSNKDASAATRIIGISSAGTDIALPAGQWRLKARADGYRPLEAQTITDGDNDLPMTLLLDPVATSDESALSTSKKVPATLASDRIEGYVRDARDGSAIADARVSDGEFTVYSDASGHFVLPLRRATALTERGTNPDRPMPASMTLYVEAAGFPFWQRSDIPLLHGVQTLLVALGGDVPSQAEFELGLRDRPLGAVVADAEVEVVVEVGADTTDSQSGNGKATALAAPLTPPASIRVGFSDAACTTPCCTGSCSNVCTLSLETYVRRGLDSEWIASWDTQSLRAGSIAYRSYGAARVANPISPSFDICSSSCCQVNDAGTHANTDAAVARTPGILLSRGSSLVFAAEYSAENNAWDDPNDGLVCSNADLSCGDGAVGSPAANWPCMADTVALGRGCFGHGRGMSQWGTQRWAIDAAPQRWRWIVDHYYNDNGNLTGAGSGLRTAAMTTPLTLAPPSVLPQQAFAGSTVALLAAGSNLAGADHQYLLIGASLYSISAGYIDDGANDLSLLLAMGDHPVVRPFDIPPATAPGTYDVLYALWLDVDEDGLISSADLPLALSTAAAALEVLPAPLFSDGFETLP